MNDATSESSDGKSILKNVAAELTQLRKKKKRRFSGGYLVKQVCKILFLE